MKRKSLLFAMMLCLAFFGVAKAQDQLTIPTDGTTLTENQYIPVYGYYVDTDGCTSEFIIPAASIDDMADGDITAMTFYISQAASAAWGATFQVYLGEVSATTLSGNYGPDDFTIVYEGELDGTGTTMSIEFDEPYHYNGGNLLVGTYVLSAGTYKRAYFSGYEATGAAYNSYEDWSGTTGAVQDFIPKTTFTYEPAQQGGCPKPTGFAVNYNGGTTATVAWNGTASQYDIDVNGTVTNNVTSPYTLSNLELATTYDVKVRANCGDEYSDYTSTKSFTTDACLSEDMCSITLALTDSYSDGWNGGKMEVVDANTGVVYGTYTISDGGSATYELALCPRTVVNFVYTAGSYGTENGWVIYDPAGEVITEEAGCNSGCNHTNGIQATYTMDCSGCFKPSNLTETNVSFTSATLSWQGTNDSYVLQYRPWNPAGDDIITTGEMVTYTVDLSQYEGTGSVAIRHYDISDMFALIVDDIQVTNAAGTVVYSQDFENCGGNMPSEFTNMDLDGDGNTWAIGSNTNLNVNGTYGIISYSYDNDSGPLTPDNWLILSGLEMGGQMTFQARGQDPNYAAENFAIYVSTENSIVEVPVTATTYNATDLTPNTPYAWQVKGICGDEETSYVSSFFKTKDDMLVFATAGNWNVVSNWEDAEGNAVTALPTAENNVRIDAAATIPAGYVAYANKATIGTGSITIEDGGQLKQNAATLRVTMEKEIAGYGTSDGNYYFIASPFNGRTLYETSGTFSHVDNMLTGEYDLYAFDATAEDGLEWINYKSSSDHIAFQADNGLAGLLYGEGYLYANQEGTTIEFEGTAGKSNNYSETKDYTFNDGTYDWDGWALVGNFFTCNAYINYVDANGNVLDADFYTLNLDNTYSLMSSNQPLPPCTGALMNVSATGKVQYSTEAPAKRASFLNMNVSRGNKTVSQARLRFGQGHNLGSMSFRNGSRLYMNVDGNDYAVVYTEKQGEMPVSFKAENNGTYSLSFTSEEVTFSYLHLIDNMTGADVNLLQTPSYTFDARTTDYASRFKLVFAVGSSANDETFGFVNASGNFCIFGIEGEATVQVIDVLGHMLSSEQFSGSYEKRINGAPGVYMVRLIQGNDVKIQKVVVR